MNALSMFKKVAGPVTQKAGMVGLKVQKNMPAILIGVGIGLGVAATIKACDATLKAQDVLAEADANMGLVNKAHSKSPEKFTEQDLAQAKVQITVKKWTELAKLYLPSLVLGALAVSAVIGGHRLLSKRNAALTAAYALLEKKFGEYRERVAGVIGEEKESEIARQLSSSEGVAEGDSNLETILGNDHVRLYTESHNRWFTDLKLAEAWLMSQQNFANDLLRVKGYMFLNDVYDILGFPRTSTGQLVGWMMANGKGKLDDPRETVIEFQFLDVSDSAGKTHKAVRFNVQPGTIWDKI